MISSRRLAIFFTRTCRRYLTHQTICNLKLYTTFLLDLKFLTPYYTTKSYLIPLLSRCLAYPTPKDARPTRFGGLRSVIVQQTMARSLMGNQPIFVSPINQVMVIFSQAQFADTEEECVDVALILCVPPFDVFPEITEHQGWGLATRCLIGLSIFYKGMEARQRRGYPAPHFYRQVGKSTFQRCGKPELSSHFENWERFIGEHLSG